MNGLMAFLRRAETLRLEVLEEHNHATPVNGEEISFLPKLTQQLTQRRLAQQKRCLEREESMEKGKI